MDIVVSSASRTPRFTWDRNLSIRQDKKYSSEDRKLPQAPGQSLVEAFLKAQRSYLDPPQYICPELEAFLRSAPERDSPLQSEGRDTYALVDDRRDDTGWQSVGQRHFARDWDGYAAYPPAGSDVHFDVSDALALESRLLKPVGSPIISTSLYSVLNFARGRKSELKEERCKQILVVLSARCEVS